MPDTNNPNGDAQPASDHLDEILVQYIRAIENGDTPSRDELLARHPDLADELREFFTDHDRMNRLAQPLCEQTIAQPAMAAAERIRYFGDYELLEEIARGGMGVVFKARQVTLNRIVAIKMILSGHLASPADVERFHTEAEAAAKLDHPGIVPIYEVGQHEGHHYFSMGFVEGRSLSSRVAEGPLPAREAVEIVRAVAEAVQYAHNKRVIHRDLKPGNILLDGQGKPRVTDFGLAKLTESVSDLTGTGQILGTPGYMPPEQAAAHLGAVGPTSDIYSLGAILYCLLTGRPPFQAATAVETLLQVQQKEPVPPRDLNPAIPRDLDTITLKCLDKSPGRRYLTAQLLADELVRFLEGRPIVARPIGTIERLARWCRRKPAVAGLSAASIAATVWAIVVLLVSRSAIERQKQLVEGQRDRAITAERQAKDEEQHAKQSEADTRAFSEFLVSDVLSVARPEGVQGGLGVDVTVAEALEVAEDSLDLRFAGRPLAEATARDAIGKTFRNLDKNDQAERHLRRAVELREQGLGPNDPATLDSRNSLGVTLSQMGRHAEAVALHEETLVKLKARLGPDHVEVLMNTSNLAQAYTDIGKLDLSLPLLEETHRKMQAKLGPDHPETLRNMNNLANAYRSVGKFDLALPLLEQALEKRTALFGPNHRNTRVTLNNLATAYLAAGRLDLALPLLEQTLTIRSEKLGPDHPDTLMTMNNLANAYLAAGQVDQAVSLHQQTLEKVKTKLGFDHQHTLASMNNLASVYRSVGRLTEAESLFREAATGTRRTLGIGHPQTQTSLQHLVGCYNELRQPEKSEPILQELAAYWKEKAGADSPDYASRLAILGVNLLQQHKGADAELALRESLRIREKTQADDWSTIQCKCLVVDSLLDQKKYADAERLLVAAYEEMKVREAKLSEAQSPERPYHRQRLGEALDRLIRLAEAMNKPDDVEKWQAETAKLQENAPPKPPADEK